jgi:hypothetical protein
VEVVREVVQGGMGSEVLPTPPLLVVPAVSINFTPSVNE